MDGLLLKLILFIGRLAARFSVRTNHAVSTCGKLSGKVSNFEAYALINFTRVSKLLGVSTVGGYITSGSALLTALFFFNCSFSQ